jgi:uncharacterized membrane protein (DUF2068 family)
MSENAAILKKRPAPALAGIASFKLGKGVFFLLVATGVYSLSDDNLPEMFRSLLMTLHLDPGRNLFDAAFKWLGSITESNMLWVAVGTFAYADLALLEGIGLFLRYYWAANLAIAESAVFIPLEVAKLIRGFTWGMFGLLVLNIFILFYLWNNRHRLFRHTFYYQRRHPQASPETPKL